MPISEYLRNLRSKMGPTLLLVPSVTGLVFDGDGRILLVRHSNGGVWVAPGGAIDPGETPQDAVAREVWEETGLHVKPIRLCGVFAGPEFHVQYSNGDEVSYVMAVFECDRIDGHLHADEDEVLEARFFAPSELQSVNLARWARFILPPIVRSGQRTWLPPVKWEPPGASG